MKTLSILKKELYYHAGIGVTNLVLGVLSYLAIPNTVALIIACLCLIAVVFTLIPFFSKVESEDELSQKIKNEAGYQTFKIGIIILMILAIFIDRNSFSSIVLSPGLINLIVAYFCISYCVIYAVLTKKMESNIDEE